MFAVDICCEQEIVQSELALALLIRKRLTLPALVMSNMLAPPTSVLEGEAGTGVTFPSWFTCGGITLAALVVPGGLVPLESPVLAVCSAADLILLYAQSSLGLPGFLLNVLQPCRKSCVTDNVRFPHAWSAASK